MVISKYLFSLCITSIFLSLSACSKTVKKSDNTLKSQNPSEINPQEECNWCGTSEAPENVSWKTTIAPKEESGEKLIISGTIYMPDGKTPAKDILVYVYHTNIEGVYPKKGNEIGNGKHHGYLRGWMKTNSKGNYQFETIRPAPYHSHSGEPAHIHYTIQRPGYPEYWLTALWFANDPRITKEYLNSVKRSGGFSNVISITKDENNVSIGERNIILETFNK